MKTVLIVDDDFISRSRIKSLIAWEEHGYEVIGEAENGKIALSMLERMSPDIILIDMDMPVMGGLALVEHIRDQGLSCAVIAISAYDDYKYVRSSMKLGAIEYLLKSNLDEKALLDALDHAGKTSLGASVYADQARRYAQDVLIRRILLGVIQDAGEIERASGLLDIQGEFFLAAAEIDDYKLICASLDRGGRARLTGAFFDVVCGCVMGCPRQYAIRTDENVACILVNPPLKRTFIDTLGDIQDGANRLLGLSVSFCVSDPIVSPLALREVYEQLLDKLGNKLYRGKNLLIDDTAPAAQIQASPSVEFSPEMEKELTRALLVPDAQAVRNVVGTLFDDLYARRAEYTTIRRVGCEIIGVICSLCKQHRIPVERVWGEREPYNQFCLYETMPDMRSYLYKACEEFISSVQAARETGGLNPLTVEAIEYVKTHFSKSISLELVAAKVNTNSSYLSRVFKADMGVNFTTHLNRVRVEQAKRRIAENPRTPIKRVAMDCGYANYNHFFSAFKKETGLSPVVYQHSVVKMAQDKK